MPRADDQQRRSYSYDEAFCKAGHGLWQYILLAQCGWANASDAIEILCVSFILPHIKREMDISYAALSGLTFALFSGMLIGGYFWGSIADSRGRRKTLCLSLAVNAVFGILSGISPNYPFLVAFRFLSGIGAGGSLPVCFTYFSEFQQNNRRGAMISALAMCWMIGNILSGLLAWFLLPDSEYVAFFSPYGQQWRLFTILCGIPSLSSCLLISYLPESPRFLYSAGKYGQAQHVLSIMFDWNHLGPKQQFGVNNIIHPERNTESENEALLDPDDNSEIRLNPTANAAKKCCSIKLLYAEFRNGFHLWKTQLVQIFLPVRRVQSVIVMLISVLVAFGGYGMAMWMPVLMERAEKFDGSPCVIRDVNTSNESIVDESPTVYVDVLIGFLGQLPGNVAVILLMDRIGSRTMLISTAFLSALSVFLFWFTTSKATIIAMNSLFNGISVGCWDALDVLTVEMYPTSIRSAAVGNACGISRLGSILGTAIFAVFMDSSCSIPIITVFLAYALAGVAGFKLPSLRGRTLL